MNNVASINGAALVNESATLRIYSDDDNDDVVIYQGVGDFRWQREIKIKVERLPYTRMYV